MWTFNPTGCAAALNLAFPVDLIDIDPGESPSDLLAGRVALISMRPDAE